MYKTPKHLSFIRKSCFTLHSATQPSSLEEKKKQRQVENTPAAFQQIHLSPGPCQKALFLWKLLSVRKAIFCRKICMVTQQLYVTPLQHAEIECY